MYIAILHCLCSRHRLKVQKCCQFIGRLLWNLDMKYYNTNLVQATKWAVQIFASPSPYQCRIVYCWSCPFSIQRISSGNFYDVYWLYDVGLLLVLCTIICHTFEFQAYLRLLCSCLFCLFIINILQSVLLCHFFQSKVYVEILPSISLCAISKCIVLYEFVCHLVETFWPKLF